MGKSQPPGGQGRPRKENIQIDLTNAEDLQAYKQCLRKFGSLRRTLKFAAEYEPGRINRLPGKKGHSSK